MIGSLIAAGVGAVGSLVGGIASGNAANYQAKIAENNAVIARQNAAHSAAATASQTEQAGLKARAQSAGVRAGIAANNLDVDTGSPVDVQTSQREIGALDTETVANRGAEEVYGYQSQAVGYQAQSKLDRSEAGSDYLGGVLKAAGGLAANPSVDSTFSSLMSGTPSVPSSYQWMSSSTGVGSNDTEVW